MTQADCNTITGSISRDCYSQHISYTVVAQDSSSGKNTRFRISREQSL